MDWMPEGVIPSYRDTPLKQANSGGFGTKTDWIKGRDTVNTQLTVSPRS